VFTRYVAYLFAATIFLSACTPAPPTALLPGDVLARLESHYRLFKPTSAPPHKTILFFHSASDVAWYPAQKAYIERIVGRGYAVVFVDMYSGRGLNGRAVRSGALLPTEIAGDVMVSFDWARRQAWVDSERIAAWGISFGATGIMDALTLSAPGSMPTGLKAKPQSDLGGLKAVILLAPWCSDDVMGFNLIASVHADFAVQVPLLAVLPGADKVSDVALCRQILERNIVAGAPVHIQEYPGAGHTFAQPVDDYGNPFGDYDASVAADAEDRIFRFLGGRLD
jgi:dienelactone hydrolase